MTHLLEIQGYNRRGGSERHTAILARGLAQRGWQVTVAAPVGGVLSDAGALPGVRFFPVSLAGRYDIDSVIRLVRLCRNEAVDLVHTHCRNADLLGGLAARLAGVPILVTTLHGMLPHAPNRPLVERVYHKFLATGPDRLLGISQSVSRRAVERLGVSPGRVATVLNGSEFPTPAQITESRRLAADLRRHPKEILIVQAGSLEPSKDPFTLLTAALALMARGMRIRLIFVGEGRLEDALRKVVNDRGFSSQVDFIGQVVDAGPYIGACDLTCLASQWEGFGRVLTEAMSYGRPTVASRVDGMTEIVKDGVTGFLIPAGSVDHWIAALARLSGSRELRHELGENGRRRFQEKFESQRFIDETEAVLLPLINRSTASATGRREAA